MNISLLSELLKQVITLHFSEAVIAKFVAKRRGHFKATTFSMMMAAAETLETSDRS